MFDASRNMSAAALFAGVASFSPEPVQTSSACWEEDCWYHGSWACALHRFHAHQAHTA